MQRWAPSALSSGLSSRDISRTSRAIRRHSPRRPRLCWSPSSCWRRLSRASATRSAARRTRDLPRPRPLADQLVLQTRLRHRGDERLGVLHVLGLEIEGDLGPPYRNVTPDTLVNHAYDVGPRLGDYRQDVAQSPRLVRERDP